MKIFQTLTLLITLAYYAYKVNFSLSQTFQEGASQRRHLLGWFSMALLFLSDDLVYIDFA